MKVPVLTNFSKVERYQCGECRELRVDKKGMLEHMIKNHCPHDNIHMTYSGQIQPKCADCGVVWSELLDFRNEEKDNRRKYEIDNLDDLKEYVKLIKKLHADKRWWHWIENDVIKPQYVWGYAKKK